MGGTNPIVVLIVGLGKTGEFRCVRLGSEGVVLAPNLPFNPRYRIEGVGPAVGLFGEKVPHPAGGAGMAMASAFSATRSTPMMEFFVTVPMIRFLLRTVSVLLSIPLSAPFPLLGCSEDGRFPGIPVRRPKHLSLHSDNGRDDAAGCHAGH